MGVMIISAAVVAAVGIIVGFGLGLFGEKFKVEVDEREVAIRAELPGNNCGACGFPGCDGLARAINEGRAPVNQCPVGGAPVAAKIAGIMGVEAGSSVKKVAFVRCGGDCEKTSKKDAYYGIMDCSKAMNVPGGGDKACAFGCLGYGSCVKACEFDAIHLTRDIPEASDMHTAEEMMKVVGPYALKRGIKIIKRSITGKSDYPSEQ